MEGFLLVKHHISVIWNFQSLKHSTFTICNEYASSVTKHFHVLIVLTMVSYSVHIVNCLVKCNFCQAYKCMAGLSVRMRGRWFLPNRLYKRFAKYVQISQYIPKISVLICCSLQNYFCYLFEIFEGIQSYLVSNLRNLVDILCKYLLWTSFKHMYKDYWINSRFKRH